MRTAKLYLIGFSILTLSACASGSSGPDPAYVSPSFYQGYNCKQLAAERSRLNSKLNQAQQANQTGQVLNAAVTIFAISQGYGIDNGDDNVELRRLNNQYEVLDQTLIQKQCGL